MSSSSNAPANSSSNSSTDGNQTADWTVRAWPVVGVVLAVLWLFVRGVALVPATIVGQFLLGLAVGLPIAYVFRRLYVDRIDLGRVARSLPAAALYLVTFTWELVRANVDVAYRVLAPDMPIEPEVILIPLRVESDLAITTIANSITITPGTVTLDHAEDVNALYVHVVDGRDPDAVVTPIRRWEDHALEMFDEDRSPDDPVPGYVVSGGDRAQRRTDGGREKRRTDGGREEDENGGADGTEYEAGLEADSEIATETTSETEPETETEAEPETGGDDRDDE